MINKDQERASGIISKMYDNDLFSRWLGIERLEDAPGRSVLRMTVREEMTNGFKIAHGGISFSLADSALAFACNSRGKHAVSIDCSINHLKPVKAGDVLTASAEETSCGKTLATYDITVTNQEDVVVALFKGLVYRTKEDWKL
jgi:acyl-CoA thioesterase